MARQQGLACRDNVPIRLMAPHAPCCERSIGPSTPRDMGEKFQLFTVFTQLVFEAVEGQISVLHWWKVRSRRSTHVSGDEWQAKLVRRCPVRELSTQST